MNTTTWYATLLKPTWAPPSWVFGPIWSVLYAIIAISFGYGDQCRGLRDRHLRRCWQ